MRSFQLKCFAVLALTFALRAQADAPAYFVVEYKHTLPSGVNEPLQALAVNENGKVLARGAGNAVNGFLFTTQEGGFTLPDSAGNGRGPSGFNSLGQIIGTRVVGGRNQAGIWNQSLQFQAIPGLLGASNGLAINESGEAVVEEFNLSTGQAQLKVFAPQARGQLGAGLTDLNAVAELQNLRITPKAMGSRSEVVGTANSSDGTVRHAFVWQAGSTGMSVLQGFQGATGSQSAAFAVSAEGDVVGEALDPSGVVTPVLWQADTFSPQRLMSTTIRRGQALGAGANRQVVGWFEFSPNVRHAFLWKNGVFQDLNQFLPEGSALVLSEALDININGVILCKGTLGGQALIVGMIPHVATQVQVTPNEFLGGKTVSLQLVFTPSLAAPLTFRASPVSAGGRIDSIATLTSVSGNSTLPVSVTTRPLVATNSDVVAIRVVPASSLDPRAASVGGFRMLPLTLDKFVVSPAGPLQGNQSFGVNALLKDGAQIPASQFGQVFARIVVEPAAAVTLQRTRFEMNRTAQAIIEGTTHTSVDDQSVKFSFFFEKANGDVLNQPAAVANLSVSALAIASASTDKQAKWNSSITYTIKIDAPAPAGGVKLTLTSSDQNMFQVPSSATIAAGKTQVAFSVKSGIGAIPADHHVDVVIRGLKVKFTDKVTVKPL